MPPRMISDHAAAESMVGYLYQCEQALIELVARSSDPELVLFLEVLDDVHFELHGLPIELLQTKHHVARSADLADMSVDLWKSLGAWMDALDGLSMGTQPILTLLTTSDAPEDSAASDLMGANPDPASAMTKLERAARESSNVATAGARARFLNLSPDSRRILVSSIRLRPNQPALEAAADDLPRRLALNLMLPAAKVGAFLTALRGWWYGQCYAVLGTHSGIATQDLANYIIDLRDSFHPEALPTHADLPDPSADEIERYEASVFVKQLLWIAYTNEQLSIAIRDYHRAFAQRSRWHREGLLYAGELKAYEKRLVDQWQRVFADMVNDLEPDADDDVKKRAGRRLLQSMRDSDIVRIRRRYNDVMLTHGTLQHLADEREVGWHPEFQRMLEQLLTTAA